MTPRLFPSTDRVEDVNVPPNPRGARVFRVTDRTIDQRTRLVIAEDADAAVQDDASTIASVSRQAMHEVTECVELVPGDDVYRVPPHEVSHV